MLKIGDEEQYGTVMTENDTIFWRGRLKELEHTCRRAENSLR